MVPVRRFNLLIPSPKSTSLEIESDCGSTSLQLLIRTAIEMLGFCLSRVVGGTCRSGQESSSRCPRERVERQVSFPRPRCACPKARRPRCRTNSGVEVNSDRTSDTKVHVTGGLEAVGHSGESMTAKWFVCLDTARDIGLRPRHVRCSSTAAALFSLALFRSNPFPRRAQLGRSPSGDRQGSPIVDCRSAPSHRRQPHVCSRSSAYPRRCDGGEPSWSPGSRLQPSASYGCSRLPPILYISPGASFYKV